MFSRKQRFLFSAILTIAGAGACGGGEQKADTTPAAQQTPAATPGGPLTPTAGGNIITIEMVTDEAGNNKFVPNELEVHQGDVLRFTLVSGVHNVNFLPDSNRTLQPVIAPSALLQLPGQTYDIAVSFKPGHYFFQCDPHALLGMVGRLEVEERDD